MRSTRTSLALAVVLPLVMGIVFVPVFRSVQSWGYPTGNLQGVDLTAFAQRDERMMLSFAVALLVVVVVLTLTATSWRNRLLVLVAGALAAIASFIAVFASLLVG